MATSLDSPASEGSLISKYRPKDRCAIPSHCHFQNLAHAPQNKSQGSEKAILHCPEGQLEMLAKNINNSHNREGLRKPESSGRNPKGYA